MPDDLHAAFYRGRGRFWADTMVKRFTGGRFSHCELVRSEAPLRDGMTATCIGASAMDGGVRVKDITFDPGKWVFRPAPWAPADAWERALRLDGQPYDVVAIVLSNILQLGRHRKAAWTCSELLAHAFDFGPAQNYDPGRVYRHMDKRMRAFSVMLHDLEDEWKTT
jgi:hypothetical protein